MKKLAIIFSLCSSVILGCGDTSSTTASSKNGNQGRNSSQDDTTKLIVTDTLVRGKYGQWEYLGSATALRNDIKWQGFPYFFQPRRGNTGLLGLKELRLPDGYLLGSLTFDKLPLKRGSSDDAEFNQASIHYTIFKSNGCVPKGYYLPVNDNNFNSSFTIVSYDSTTTELYLTFDILFKVRASDKLKYPELPELIHFKNGEVQTKSIR
jgi:hypothetical protein